MLFIHFNNTKIRSHGIINNPIVHLGTAQRITQIAHNNTQGHMNIPTHGLGLSWMTLGISPLNPNLRNWIHGHSGLGTSLSIKMALSQRINQVGENPYLSEFVETPQYRYPRIALIVGINFASCLTRIRRTDRLEI